MSVKYDFKGRNALVTGGATGVGKATVKKFLDAGAKVYVVDKDEKLIAQLVEEYPAVTAVSVDLSNWDETAEKLKTLPAIHHLVNNAGVSGTPVKLLDIQPKHIDQVFDVNFKAIINVSQVVAREVIKNKLPGATIVNISSVMSKMPYYGVAMYSASKAAVSMLTRSMAVEFEPHNIRVNAVLPTIMETNMTRGKHAFDIPGEEHTKAPPAASDKDDLPKFTRFLMERQIHKRLLTVDETADLILYLSSDASSMLFGEDVLIDGGMFAN